MRAFASVEGRELARSRLEQGGDRREAGRRRARRQAGGGGDLANEVGLEDHERRFQRRFASELLNLTGSDVQDRAGAQPVAREVDRMRALAAGHQEEVVKGRALRSREVVVPLVTQEPLQGEGLHPQGAIPREGDVGDARRALSHFDHPSFHIDLVRPLPQA